MRELVYPPALQRFDEARTGLRNTRGALHAYCEAICTAIVGSSEECTQLPCEVIVYTRRMFPPLESQYHFAGFDCHIHIVKPARTACPIDIALDQCSFKACACSLKISQLLVPGRRGGYDFVFRIWGQRLVGSVWLSVEHHRVTAENALEPASINRHLRSSSPAKPPRSTR
jgi:hypothetical protein